MSPSIQLLALDRDAALMDQAMRSDSPQAALRAARAAGGPQGAPHLVAVAAAQDAPHAARHLLAHGWPAEALSSHGQNALWHAIYAQAGLPHAGSLARDLLKAGADASFLGPVGSAFGEAAGAGDLGLIELMLASCEGKAHGPLHLALSHGLWEASGIDSPLALAGCRALSAAGADWAYEPTDTHWLHDPDNPGFRFNCAQHAVFTGSIDALAEPAALAALAARHPPLQNGGPSTGWRELLAPSRLHSVERWILGAEAPSQTLAPPAARRRL